MFLWKIHSRPKRLSTKTAWRVENRYPKWVALVSGNMDQETCGPYPEAPPASDSELRISGLPISGLLVSPISGLTGAGGSLGLNQAESRKRQRGQRQKGVFFWWDPQNGLINIWVNIQKVFSCFPPPRSPTPPPPSLPKKRSLVNIRAHASARNAPKRPTVR